MVNAAIASSAFLSLTRITNRLQKTFVRLYPLRDQRRIIQFFNSIAELEAEPLFVNASSRVTARVIPASPRSGPGLASSYDSASGSTPRLPDTGDCTPSGLLSQLPQVDSLTLLACGADFLPDDDFIRRINIELNRELRGIQ